MIFYITIHNLPLFLMIHELGRQFFTTSQTFLSGSYLSIKEEKVCLCQADAVSK